MDSQDFNRLVRRAFSDGVTGKEAFELELEANADERARQVLEQAEQDDRHIFRLRAALERQVPWYRSAPLAMAASAVLGAGLTLLITSGTPDPGIASGSVYYLESTRGGPGADLPELALGNGEHRVTLVLYPAHDDFARFVIDVQRLESADGDSGAVWSSVWSGDVGAGSREALAITLERSLLSDGIHRVNLDGVTADDAASVPAGSLQFRVVTTEEP